MTKLVLQLLDEVEDFLFGNLRENFANGKVRVRHTLVTPFNIITYDEVYGVWGGMSTGLRKKWPPLVGRGQVLLADDVGAEIAVDVDGGGGGGLVEETGIEVHGIEVEFGYDVFGEGVDHDGFADES